VNKDLWKAAHPYLSFITSEGWDFL
jgi:hypothetical protein